MSTTVSTQGTEAFDAATVALALESYKQTAGSTDYWSSSRRSNVATSNQETLLDWMCDHGDALPNISPEWMHALASDDHRVLNALLEKHGFEPHFLDRQQDGPYYIQVNAQSRYLVDNGRLWSVDPSDHVAAMFEGRSVRDGVGLVRESIRAGRPAN